MLSGKQSHDVTRFGRKPLGATLLSISEVSRVGGDSGLFQAIRLQPSTLAKSEDPDTVERQKLCN